MYKDPFFFVQCFFSSTLTIVVWGFLGKWLAGDTLHNASLQVAMFLSFVSWELMQRSYFDISGRFQDEINDGNIINIFASPLQLLEYLFGLLLLACINLSTIISIIFFVAFCFYDIALWRADPKIIPFMGVMVFSGLSMGLCGASFLITTGKKFYGIIFIMIRSFAPLSGAFYPVTVLPKPLLFIARILPFGYATEGIRVVMLHGTFDWYLFIVSITLSFVCFACATYLFFWSFLRSKERGLARLND